jgi:cellulase/cellobiase CelA1
VTGKICSVATDCVSKTCQNQVCVAPTTSGVSAALNLTSNWDGGYCAQISVTNGGSSATSSWTVVFDMGQSNISSLWEAQYTKSGTQVTAKSLTWNGRIEPNSSTSFGFCATKLGAAWQPKILSANAP